MAPPLPVIGIAPFLSANAAACRDYGFFYLNLDGFASNEETDELTRLANAFFKSPQKWKDRLSLRHSDQARGYARMHENVTNGKADNHEGIDFYRPVKSPDRSKPLQGENQWPNDQWIPGFKEKFDKWIDKMQNLGLMVMEAMAMGLGMTTEEWKSLRSQVDESFWVMRIIGYPSLPDDHDGYSCGAHRDYGCLTFLYADPTPSALQVYLHNPSMLNGTSTPAVAPLALPDEANGTGVWINADPIEGCIVCNIGEMWEIWTNGLYKSTLHRVVHRGKNYSIPFFFEPNFTAEISPLKAIERLSGPSDIDKLKADGKPRNSVIYGDFLLKKVAGNFSENGGGRYGDDDVVEE